MSKVKISDNWDKKTKENSKGTQLPNNYHFLLKGTGVIIPKNLHLLYMGKTAQK